MTSPQEREKAQKVSAMFARISRRYDFMNSVMSAGRHHAWRRTAVTMAAPPEDALSLDVACGTGDFAMELARRPGRQVIGVDICPDMLVVAREKAKAMGVQDRVHFQVADALALPFPDDRFHSVTIGFGLRNVASIPSCLRELCRVTRPGGRVVSLELTSLGRGPMAPLVGLYMRRCMPWLGALLAHDREAYQYLPNSIADFPRAEGLAELMRGAGFSVVWFRQLALGTVSIHVGQK